MPPGEVPVEGLQRALEHAQITPNELASRLGWMRTNARGYCVPDQSRVRRALGLRDYTCAKQGHRRRGRLVTYATAEAILTALHADPVQYGL